MEHPHDPTSPNPETPSTSDSPSTLNTAETSNTLNTPNTPNTPHLPDSLTTLDRQIRAALYRTEGQVARLTQRLNETETYILGLLELLLADGTITKEALLERFAAVRPEIKKRDIHYRTAVDLRTDSITPSHPDPTAAPHPVIPSEREERRQPSREQSHTTPITPIDPPINCAERLHVCKAACCRLHFSLSAAEVEQGIVKWDLGRPYRIRQSPTGYCTHIHAGTCACTIYENRPKPCRTFTCRHDDRIWLDFDNMVLNQAWLDANLQAPMADASMTT